MLELKFTVIHGNNPAGRADSLLTKNKTAVRDPGHKSCLKQPSFIKLRHRLQNCSQCSTSVGTGKVTLLLADLAGNQGLAVVGNSIKIKHVVGTIHAILQKNYQKNRKQFLDVSYHLEKNKTRNKKSM